MLAAEQNQAEQELSKSIRQPRDVRLASSCFNRELSSCGGHLRSFLKPASGMSRAGKNETRFSTKRCSRPFLHNGDVRSVASRRYQPLWHQTDQRMHMSGCKSSGRPICQRATHPVPGPFVMDSAFQLASLRWLARRPCNCP